MALRLASKIRCSIVQSCSRTLAAKSDTVAAAQQQASDNAGETGDNPKPLQRFSVYQAPSLARTADNENILRQQMDNRQLQPSMLPNYYKPEIDVQHGTYPIHDTLAHNSEPLSMKQRRFEVSKTYANVTLPLKMPKLASPFPDPVKIMSSHTISDQEKADQMLAEARVPKGTVEQNVAKPSINRVQTRNYSSQGKTVGRDDSKCKKIGKKKKKCVKITMPGCKPPKSISCEREAKPIKCKKIHAPYPSYSEACYEEVPEKPSECKLCPWRPRDNPNFKQPKKKYHTNADDGITENVAYRGIRNIAAEETKCCEQTNGYLADAKKKPCKDPNAPKKRSSKDKSKKKKTSKSKSKSKGKSKSKSKKKKKKGGSKKKAANWTTAMQKWREVQENAEDSDIVINQKAIHAKKKKGEKKKKPCKKFPFDKCKKKDEKKKPKKDKCKKKKKPIVKGCLSKDNWETIAISENGGSFIENKNAMELAKCKKKDDCDKKDKQKKKCKKPKVQKKPKPKEEVKSDDPCDQRKPGSRKCPADLIESSKRRRKPDRNKNKKRTSARVTAYIPAKSRRRLQETTAT